MSPTPSYTMREQLLREAVEMVRFSFASGKSVPTSVVDTVEMYESHAADPNAAPMDPTPLVLAHARLAKIVAPATPKAIVLLADERIDRGRWGFLGPVPLVRRMMTVAVVCVIGFILLSLTQMVNGTDIDVTSSQGLELLVNELFWLFAAGVGASFAMLFQVNDYIVRCTYDPKYEPSYWIKFFLGVMAGFIIVAMVPIPESKEAGLQLAKPTIAMLGGYSASAVYRILTRLVETIESLFRGNAKEVIAEREQAAAARAAEEASRARVRMAAQLVELQQRLATGATTEELAQHIRGMVTTLTPEVTDVEAIPAPTPTVQAALPAAGQTTPEAPVAIA